MSDATTEVSRNEMTEIRDAWISWELLRRAVCFNNVQPMNLDDIAEACGFEDRFAVAMREGRALERCTVNKDV